MLYPDSVRGFDASRGILPEASAVRDDFEVRFEVDPGKTERENRRLMDELLGEER